MRQKFHFGLYRKFSVVWLVICSKNTFFIFVLKKKYFILKNNILCSIKCLLCYQKCLLFSKKCLFYVNVFSYIFENRKTLLCSENESAQGSWIFFVLMSSLKFRSVKYSSNPTRTATNSICIKALFSKFSVWPVA